MKIFRNMSIKALSLISALVLWFFVVGVENYVYLFPQPLAIKVVNLGQNVSVANEISPAQLRYKSTDGAINTLNVNDFDLYIDAKGLGEGEYQLPVHYNSKDSKINIVDVEPPLVALRLEAITSKDISLKTAVSGQPAKGFEVKEVKMDLEKVKLSGASSAITNIKEIGLKISLDGSENADFSRKITLEAPAEWKLAGKTVSFDPPTVQVEIQVRKVPKDTPDIPDLTNNGVTVGNSETIPMEAGSQRKTLMVKVVPEDSLKSAVKELLPANILVTVEGLPADIEKIDKGSLSLVIHSKDIVKGNYQIKVDDLVKPANLELKIIELSPANVTVKF